MTRPAPPTGGGPRSTFRCSRRKRRGGGTFSKAPYDLQAFDGRAGTRRMTRPLPHRPALGFSLALGAIGWALVIAAPWLGVAAPPPATDEAWTFVLFLA